MSAKGGNPGSADSNSIATKYIRNNPRMIGVLFTILLLISQAGTVAAGNNAAISGP